MCFRLVAQTLINRRIAEIAAKVGSGEPTEGQYLTYLLSSDKLTKAEVYICTTELLLGGVDTVRWEMMAAVHTCIKLPVSRLVRRDSLFHQYFILHLFFNIHNLNLEVFMLFQKAV